jgi:putative SOS response-associated peptidase YedK
MTGRFLRSPAYGRPGVAREVPRARRSWGSTNCSASWTTEANAIVAPIHPKAMPVILTSPSEFDLGLEGQMPEPCKLQRPLPDAALKIVAKGEKDDRVPEFLL